MSSSSSSSTANALKTMATYVVKTSTTTTTTKQPQQVLLLSIARGSVLDFHSPSSTNTAIVNAANEGCLGGGGVDGAISNGGGRELHQHRLALPILDPDEENEIRCRTGSAVTTGPASNGGYYGSLLVNHVIHAVGPNYWTFGDGGDDDDDDDSSSSYDEPDRLLRSAYQSSLDCAVDANIESMAFSLLSAGIFRGSRSLHEILDISVTAIKDWITTKQEQQHGEVSNINENNDNDDTKESKTDDDDNDDEGNKNTTETTSSSSSPWGKLESITLCGFSAKEISTLLRVCESMDELERVSPPQKEEKEKENDEKEDGNKIEEGTTNNKSPPIAVAVDNDGDEGVEMMMVEEEDGAKPSSCEAVAVVEDEPVVATVEEAPTTTGTTDDEDKNEMELDDKDGKENEGEDKVSTGSEEKKDDDQRVDFKKKKTEEEATESSSSPTVGAENAATVSKRHIDDVEGSRNDEVDPKKKPEL